MIFKVSVAPKVTDFARGTWSESLSQWMSVIDLERSGTELPYLSLNAAPPLELTEITASSKLHDKAACTTLAPARRIEGISEWNRIVWLWDGRGAWSSRVDFLRSPKL
jgi:hypothetical protein